MTQFGATQFEMISSKDNPLLKQIRLLQAVGSKGHKHRLANAQAVIEGVHLLQTWVGDASLTTLLTSAAGLVNTEVGKAIERHLVLCPQTRLVELDEELWPLISELANAPHFLGLIQLPNSILQPITEELKISGDVVVLEGIQDAGNVGSILRTAAATGVKTVIALFGCAHLWSSKVLRAAMGAHHQLTLYEDWTPSELIVHIEAPLLITAAQGKTDLYTLQAQLKNPVVWVFGNEGHGVTAALRSQGQVVSIPLNQRVESLNVATAAAVCLFETVRVRSG